MTDITKCSGKGCKRRGKCWRYLATADSTYQSWFQKPPKTTLHCEYFMRPPRGWIARGGNDATDGKL